MDSTGHPFMKQKFAADLTQWGRFRKNISRDIYFAFILMFFMANKIIILPKMYIIEWLQIQKLLIWWLTQWQ